MTDAIIPARGFSLAPTTFAEAERFAKIIADSDFAPKEFRGKPGACLIAMQFGAELGLAPTAALQNIAVINGKPSIYGDAALAVIRSHSRFAGIAERSPDEALRLGAGECSITTRDGVRVTRSFSVDDAKKANLWGKQGPWSQYPGRMLQMRSRSWAMRDAMPEALKGISIREEAEDIPSSANVIETRKPDAPIETAQSDSIDVASESHSPTMTDAEKNLVSILERIEAAESQAALVLIAPDCAKLDESSKAKAKVAYAKRKAEL